MKEELNGQGQVNLRATSSTSRYLTRGESIGRWRWTGRGREGPRKGRRGRRGKERGVERQRVWKFNQQTSRINSLLLLHQNHQHLSNLLSLQENRPDARESHPRRPPTLHPPPLEPSTTSLSLPPLELPHLLPSKSNKTLLPRRMYFGGGARWMWSQFRGWWRSRGRRRASFKRRKGGGGGRRAQRVKGILPPPRLLDQGLPPPPPRRAMFIVPNPPPPHPLLDLETTQAPTSLSPLTSPPTVHLPPSVNLTSPSPTPPPSPSPPTLSTEAYLPPPPLQRLPTPTLLVNLQRTISTKEGNETRTSDLLDSRISQIVHRRLLRDMLRGQGRRGRGRRREERRWLVELR